MSKPFDPATLPANVARPAAKLEQLRAALADGEQSGIAPTGSFDRARAQISELAARRTP